MKIVFTLLLLAAIVAAGVFYQLFLSTPNSATEGDESNLRINETIEVDSQNENFAGVGTLQMLLARGENLECTVTYKPSDFEEEIAGSYFVADGLVRGDFLVPTVGFDEPIYTSFIYTNETAYVWSEIDGQSYGTQTKLQTETEVKDAPVPATVSVKYNCKPWRAVDYSIFEPPATVLFKDTEALLRTGMEYGTVYEEGEF